MTVAVPREREDAETRVAATAQTVEKLAALGARVLVEAGAGVASGQNDADYEKAGATVVPDHLNLLSQGDIVFRVGPPPADEVGLLKEGCIHVSHLDPFTNPELIQQLAERRIQAISMEMIPRTTRAQKMDSLSSQASLAGYVAVMLAAERLPQVFPMMVTPAGTISPSRVFIIGAGVAGLQAIATAKRLGAIVEAFDTRPVVEEQVRSLGARFIKVDLGETGQTKDGYARALTEEQLARQREMMAGRCAASDVVITTAQVFGRKAPLIVTDEIVRRMRPGSLIVDMAVASGGNVEGSELDREVDRHGVRIIGIPQLARRVPVHASQMYAANLYNFVEEFWDKEKKELVLDRDDEIVRGCLLTSGGKLVNERLQEEKTS